MPPKGWKKADRIQGWFTQEEAELLSRLCTGPWCEIGCHKGRSTVILAETGYEGYAIDTWLGSPEMPRLDSFSIFLRNLDQYENVTAVQCDFREVPDDLIPALQLLHLDADHSYEMTKLAFELYAPKVVPGGYVCFHDARGGGWPDVEQCVAELPADEWEHVETAFSLAAYRKL